MQKILDQLANLIVVTGHYGSGKTNLSVNLALLLRARGRAVTLADLDVVNPYFRTADFVELARERGIELVLPNFANSSLDIPSLNPRLDAALRDEDTTLIIDVGGDDDGAWALGRYSAAILERDYTMLYVVNRYRHIGGETAEAVRLLTAIETVSRLRVTAIVDNANLGADTQAADLLAAAPFAQTVASETGKPIAFTVAKRDICEQIARSESGRRGEILPVDRLVRLPWEGEAAKQV